MLSRGSGSGSNLYHIPNLFLIKGHVKISYSGACCYDSFLSKLFGWGLMLWIALSFSVQNATVWIQLGLEDGPYSSLALSLLAVPPIASASPNTHLMQCICREWASSDVCDTVNRLLPSSCSCGFPYSAQSWNQDGSATHISLCASSLNWVSFSVFTLLLVVCHLVFLGTEHFKSKPWCFRFDEYSEDILEKTRGQKG